MTDSVTVLVLGGGVGGVVAARSLRRKLPEDHRVVIVDRERDHLFAPSLLWFGSILVHPTQQRLTDLLTRL